MADFELLERTFIQNDIPKKCMDQKSLINENKFQSNNILENDSNDIRVTVYRENPWKDEEECTHENLIIVGISTMCEQCGEEIASNKISDKNWKFYEEGKRCQPRREVERNIYKDLDGKGIPENVAKIADTIFRDTTGGGIRRKVSRSGVVFGCVFEAYKQAGIPQDLEKLTKAFCIKQTDASRGHKYVKLEMPKVEYLTTYKNASPRNNIINIMNGFQANPSNIEEVLNIYERVKYSNKILSGSKPLSVASGIIYYWIVNNKNIITIREFSIKVGLSEITIKKIYNAVDEKMKELNKEK